MKKFVSLMMASALALSATAFVACGKKNEVKGDRTLNVYALNAGYKVEWLEGVKQAFVSEGWVKQKYGNVAVDIDEDSDVAYAADIIKSGRTANKYDVLFGMNLQSLYGLRGGKDYLLADLKDVYESTVPGETIDVQNKMLESAVKANEYMNVKGEKSWYAMPWAGGYNGILYNAEKLAEGDYQVPVTTDEMLAIMAAETEKNGYSIMQSSKEGEKKATYWEHLFPTWWAQYEGYNNYTKFWEGKVYNEETSSYEYSVDIFKQKGRLESLKVIETALKENLYSLAPSTDYGPAQRMFVKGNGMFMACGDWFDMEMSDTIRDLVNHGDKVYDIQMMKTPVISAINEKLDSIADDDDATLAAVVRAIDNGATSYEGVSEEDFETVEQARNILYSVGNYHTAVIPSYARNMDLAKDFLRYLATDKANEIYTQKTGGSGLFFKYNVKESNPTLYETLSDTAKMRIDCFSSPDALVLPIPNNYNMFIYGNVRNFKTNFSSYEYLFTQTNTTAESLYKYDIDKYTATEWDAIEAILKGVGEE